MGFEILLLCLGIFFILTILGVIRYTYIQKSSTILCFTFSTTFVFLYILTKIDNEILGASTELFKNLLCDLWIISYYVLNKFLFNLKKTNWLNSIINFGVFYFLLFIFLENNSISVIKNNILTKKFISIASVVDLFVVFSVLIYAFKNRQGYKKYIFIGTFFMLISSSEFVITYVFNYFNLVTFWKKSSLFSVNLMVGVQAIDFILFYTSFLIQDKEKEIQFQKTLNASILETQEQLLNSISQDLHDDAGQQLTVINFQLENLKLDINDNENKLEAVSTSVVQLANSLRKISHSLNPNWLENIGFINAIKSESNRISGNKGIEISTNINDDINPKINHEIEIVIFRIFQETINNILKHAKASRIEINISTSPKLIIEIADNGKGFNADDEGFTDSMGLKNCKSRAKLINFDYQINSEIGRGTKVLLTEN